MNRLVKWLAGIAAVFCVLFVGITQIVMPGLLEKAGPYAEKMAAGYVNGTVQLGSVTWPGSNTLLVKDILVRDQKQQTVATVPEIRVSVNPFKAFSGLEKATGQRRKVELSELIETFAVGNDPILREGQRTRGNREGEAS